METRCDYCGGEVKKPIHEKGYVFCSNECCDEAYEELKEIQRAKKDRFKQKFSTKEEMY